MRPYKLPSANSCSNLVDMKKLISVHAKRTFMHTDKHIQAANLVWMHRIGCTCMHILYVVCG